MGYETQATLPDAQMGGNDQRRERRASRRRPAQWSAGLVTVPAAPSMDRLQAETGLLGALALVDEGLAAAEESYWRVLAIFEGSLGTGHPEVAAMKRRIADAHLGCGILR